MTIIPHADGQGVLMMPIDGMMAQRIAIGSSGNANGYSEYIGVAVAGTTTATARWSIKKLEYDASGNVVAVHWADGTNEFTKKWDDRATYDYTV